MTQQFQNVIGHNAIDSEGEKIGKIGQLYLDDHTDQPQWVTVSTGLFGTKESFAPVYGSSVEGEDLRLSVTKDLVKDAPKMDTDGHLSDDEVAELYHYYAGHTGPDTSAETAGVGGQDHDRGGVADQADTHGEVGGPGQDTSGRNTDDAMTRSEERVHVGTENVETGRARLRKYIVTENVTQTVPVTHEEVRVEREPITDANVGSATDGPAISEEEHEVTLHAERPVVEKETVPVERVRLGTEQVTEQHEVNESVRKEQIETEGADRQA